MSTEKMILVEGKPAMLIMPDLTDHFLPMWRTMDGVTGDISALNAADIDYWPEKSVVTVPDPVEQLAMYATHKKYGSVEELVRTEVFDDSGASTIRLTRVLDGALYTLSRDEYLGPKPLRVSMGTAAIKVTGEATKLIGYATDPVSSQGMLATNYAEVTVQLDRASGRAAGIAYRINGVVSDEVEHEVMAGNTFALYSGNDIAEVTMVPINASGDHVPDKTIVVSVKYWNIAPGDDAR